MLYGTATLSSSGEPLKVLRIDAQWRQDILGYEICAALPGHLFIYKSSYVVGMLIIHMFPSCCGQDLRESGSRR